MINSSVGLTLLLEPTLYLSDEVSGPLPEWILNVEEIEENCDRL
jgi:hypothetical protein